VSSPVAADLDEPPSSPGRRPWRPGGSWRPGSGPRPQVPAVVRRLPRPAEETLWTVGLGLLLAVIALRAGGGFQLGRITGVEMGLQVAGGALVAAAVLHHRTERVYGAWAALAFLVLAVYTALSILWAVNPSDTWLEANRTLAYLATFCGGVALARLAPQRWSALIGATLLCATIVCSYALLTKVLPGTFAQDETFARLREPFGYWNSVGLIAALGVPGALWLGSRRHGHAAVSALAYPALGILIVTILLAYSRGSLLAVIVGAGVWFVAVPLRLRGMAALAAGALGGGAVALWVFAQDALTKDDVPLGLRETAGQQLGLALLAMLAILTLAGLVALFTAARRPPDPQVRRRAGSAIVVALALVPVVLTGGLAFSDKGLGGSISDGWTKLTDPDASLPANDPGRLTAVGSVRARYWDQAFKIVDDEPVLGVGAGGYATARPRYRTDDLAVRHAHGWLPQTVADLGLLGLAVSLSLLVAWLLAARRTLGLRRGWREEAIDAERVGLFTLTAIVVTFGVHSFVDFTWFVPGLAVVALLSAGWVAGRGPLGAHAGAPALDPDAPAVPSVRERVREGAADRRRLVAAVGVFLVALVAAWQTWQPYRSLTAGQDALALAGERKFDEAREKAETARDRNPLSVEPLYELGAVELAAGRIDRARAALEEAVRLQPSNASPWLRLAEHRLIVNNDPQRALQVLAPALFLDPRSGPGTSLFLEAQRRAAGAPAGGAPGTPTPVPPAAAAPGTPPAATAPATPPPSPTPDTTTAP
jgi:hypothetical protein